MRLPAGGAGAASRCAACTQRMPAPACRPPPSAAPPLAIRPAGRRCHARSSSAWQVARMCSSLAGGVCLRRWGAVYVRGGRSDRQSNVARSEAWEGICTVAGFTAASRRCCPMPAAPPWCVQGRHQRPLASPPRLAGKPPGARHEWGGRWAGSHHWAAGRPGHASACAGRLGAAGCPSPPDHRPGPVCLTMSVTCCCHSSAPRRLDLQSSSDSSPLDSCKVTTR